MHNRVLFLDIDGVLSGYESSRFHPRKDERIFTAPMRVPRFDELDGQQIGMLADLVNGLDIKVVISSTWRDFYSYQSIDQFMAAMHPYWKEGTCIGQTPPTVASRSDDINRWLASNPTKEYAIIDDREDILPDPEHRKRLSLCDGEVGLTHYDIHKLMWVFKRSRAGKHHRLRWDVLKGKILHPDLS